MSRPTEFILNLPEKEVIRLGKEGWHYVIPGPMCNCFTHCATCEIMGYVTHRGADWTEGPWVKYEGELETKDQRFRAQHNGFGEDEITITFRSVKECENPCHKKMYRNYDGKMRPMCDSCSDCPPKEYTVTHISGISRSQIGKTYKETVAKALVALREAVDTGFLLPVDVYHKHHL